MYNQNYITAFQSNAVGGGVGSLAFIIEFRRRCRPQSGEFQRVSKGDTSFDLPQIGEVQLLD